MAGSPRPSFPSNPGEPNLRRLGVGGGVGGDRPLRAQLVIALMLVLVLIGVPLYLLRRPAGNENAPGALAGGPDGGAAVQRAFIRTKIDSGREQPRVKLGPVQRVKCSAGARVRGNEGSLCDALAPIEDAFADAIKKNVDCAPRTGAEGTINFALAVDFSARQLKVFPGASGAWRGPQAQRTAQCVSRSMPPVEWDTIAHQYRYYIVAIMATYPAPDPMGLGGPSFE